MKQLFLVRITAQLLFIGYFIGGSYYDCEYTTQEKDSRYISREQSITAGMLVPLMAFVPQENYTCNQPTDTKQSEQK